MNGSASSRPLILVVEDEIIIAMEIQVRLENEGFAVCGIAATGERAIRTAREKKPDIILMDITLRGEMDGLEAARLIQEERSVPVIFLSASDNQDLLRQIRENRLGRFVSKPFNETDLIAAIRRTLGG